MNEWPDELWENERSRMWDIAAQFANVADEETDPSLCTIGSSGLREARGLLTTWSLFVGMALLAVTAGSSITRMTLRRKAFGSVPVARHT